MSKEEDFDAIAFMEFIENEREYARDQMLFHLLKQQMPDADEDVLIQNCRLIKKLMGF